MRRTERYDLKWNGELRRLAVGFGCLSAAVLLMANLWLTGYRRELRRRENLFCAAVAGNVENLYPGVEEEQLIRLLKDGGNLETGQKILERYGFFRDGTGGSPAGMEKHLAALGICFNLFFVGGAGAGGLLFFSYLRKRQGKIEELAEYMEALNRKNYHMEIEDNSDDELSGLRNEIYKLAVFLTEQAGRAVSQKKALADSVANISHQLKTPLTSMTILVDNLSENAAMEEETRKRFLREVSRQLSGMSWLIAVMLKLSRLESGVVELERRECPLRELAEGAVRKLEVTAELAEVDFQVEIEEGILLMADRNWMEEALVNLLKNAVEHSPAGSRVEIFGADNEVYTQLRITDHGTGISGEERRKIFQRFYRGDAAREDSTGIGLALAKEIVEKHGGRIEVDTEENRGTVFSIKFLK